MHCTNALRSNRFALRTPLKLLNVFYYYCGPRVPLHSQTVGYLWALIWTKQKRKMYWHIPVMIHAMCRTQSAHETLYRHFYAIIPIRLIFPVLTLLTNMSASSKCRPYIFGDSPGIGSILMHTSWPLRALSTCLWLHSIDVTTPISRNWNTNNTTILSQMMEKIWRKLLGTHINVNCYGELFMKIGTISMNASVFKFWHSFCKIRFLCDLDLNASP